MLIYKMQTHLSEKMPPPPKKKGKIKKRKKWDKIRKWFFHFNFLGGVLSLRQVRFLKIILKFSIFLPYMTLCKKKNISPIRWVFFQIFQDKKKKKIEPHQNKENAFSKIVFDIFCPSKTTRSIVQNHRTLVHMSRMKLLLKQYSRRKKKHDRSAKKKICGPQQLQQYYQNPLY
jgi:hypothetical protein